MKILDPALFRSREMWIPDAQYAQFAQIAAPIANPWRGGDSRLTFGRHAAGVSTPKFTSQPTAKSKDSTPKRPSIASPLRVSRHGVAPRRRVAWP
jgi:hypothetical protein